MIFLIIRLINLMGIAACISCEKYSNRFLSIFTATVNTIVNHEVKFTIIVIIMVIFPYTLRMIIIKIVKIIMAIMMVLMIRIKMTIIT